MNETRVLVLMRAPDASGAVGALGDMREVLRVLSSANTAPDGSPESMGLVFGPGLVMELPLVDDRDEVKQVIVTVHDDEVAWPVLSRLCKQHEWRLVDPETGRAFGG